MSEFEKEKPYFKKVQEGDEVFGFVFGKVSFI